jgi:hypothetical protein
MFLGVLVAIASAVSAKEYPWELKKNEDGIRVSVREVEGSSILEYKGTVTVDASVEEAVRLFEDDARTTEWFYECTESRTLKEETDTPVRPAKIIYSVIHMPWPVSDRDVVFRRVRSTPGFHQTGYSHGGTKESSVRSEDPATGAVRYENSALPGEYPEQKGKVRMPYLKGSWSFTPLKDGGTEVTYQEHSEVGGHIPDWLVNKLAVNIPFNSLASFRQLLSKARR